MDVSEDTVAQKDYVSRAKKGGQRKKTTGKKRKSKPNKSSASLLLLLIVIVAAFAGGLYFLKSNGNPSGQQSGQTEQKKPSTKVKNATETIPPTPAKRWVYVDALVNPGIHNGKNSASGAGNGGAPGMSPEQQRILSMMEADRPQNATGTPATYNQQVGRNSQNSQQPPQTSTQTAAGPAANVSAPPASQNWVLQCGSFRNKEGAESIKAQLALSGISSQISFSDNLHRVILGPYKTKDAAAKAQAQVKNAGINSCHIRG
jgi:cell division protein FtsN